MIREKLAHKEMVPKKDNKAKAHKIKIEIKS